MAHKIGFIGLGMMGLPMVKNLIKAGHSLIVYDVDRAAMDSLSDSEALKASSPAELSAQSEITITMLPSTPHVKEVATGPQGILEGIKAGSIYIDMSTILPTYTRELATIFKSAECKMLDAPVSRGQPAAIKGTLSIMVGGEKEIFDQCLDVFKAMGTDIYYCGQSGNGAVVKLVNNLMIGIIAPAISEALVMGIKGGVKLETILEVIKGSSSNSWMLENFFPLTVFNGSFKPGFKLDLMKKDLGLVHEFALQLPVPLFLGALSQQLFEIAHMEGIGDLDFTSISQIYENLAGVKPRFS